MASDGYDNGPRTSVAIIAGLLLLLGGPCSLLGLGSAIGPLLSGGKGNANALQAGIGLLVGIPGTLTLWAGLLVRFWGTPEAGRGSALRFFTGGLSAVIALANFGLLVLLFANAFASAYGRGWTDIQNSFVGLLMLLALGAISAATALAVFQDGRR